MGVSEEVIDTFELYFGRRDTTVTIEETPSGRPTDFAVFRDGDQCLAAGAVEPAFPAIGFDPAALSGKAFAPTEYSTTLEHAATTAFTPGYRGVIASARTPCRPSGCVRHLSFPFPSSAIRSVPSSVTA